MKTKTIVALLTIHICMLKHEWIKLGFKIERFVENYAIVINRFKINRDFTYWVMHQIKDINVLVHLSYDKNLTKIT